MINMVGELVITQSMLSQVGSREADTDLERLRDGLVQLERNTRELQESVMAIRMVPMSAAFGRIPRVVHDLASKLGKTHLLQAICHHALRHLSGDRRIAYIRGETFINDFLSNDADFSFFLNIT